MESSTTQTYNVRTASFEGPLGLLLSLIEQRKLFINEVSLADVTADYLAYVKQLSEGHEQKGIGSVSSFVLVAATLILIKSRSLLPDIALSNEEEEKIKDLEHRLRLYQIIKEASIDVKTNFGAKIIFFPNDRTWSEPVFVPDQQITSSNMFASIESVLTALPKKAEPLPEIEVKKVINIDEMINNLTERIQSAMNMSFREFAKSHNAENQTEARVHIIVSFLAMLELVREGLIDVIQNNSFEDIHINKQHAPEITHS